MICKPIETSDPFDMSKQIPEKGAINPLFKEVYYFHFRWPGLNMLLGTRLLGRPHISDRNGTILWESNMDIFDVTCKCIKFETTLFYGKVRLPEGIHIQNYTLYYTRMHTVCIIYRYIYTHIPSCTYMNAGDKHRHGKKTSGVRK